MEILIALNEVEQRTWEALEDVKKFLGNNKLKITKALYKYY